LQIINEIAPDDRRAEVVSSYFLVALSGKALPVVGVRIVATRAGPINASASFAALIAVFAIGGWIMELTTMPPAHVGKRACDHPSLCPHGWILRLEGVARYGSTSYCWETSRVSPVSSS
jgi:hypothetical protein